MAKNESYQEFVRKFKPKLTTDDCYTPPPVYECVLEHVDRHVMPLAGRRVLRPFYPDGDFEREEYRDGDVVVDNPPFSILARIVDYYISRNIPFFLFAPSLTLFSYGNRPTVTCIVVDATIIFENGASINIGFLTNMLPEHPAFVLDAQLRNCLLEANKQPDKRKRKIVYPDCVVSSAMLQKIVTRGISWTVPRSSVQWIRRLDCGMHIYGAGFLLSERAAAERAAAERAAAERAAAERAVLSERELDVQRSLSDSCDFF